MRAAFLSYDKNRDGKIDRAELEQAFRDMGKVLPKEDIDRIMQLADKGKTGYLTYEEFIAQVFKVWTPQITPFTAAFPKVSSAEPRGYVRWTQRFRDKL